jgi:hypothetical protein
MQVPSCPQCGKADSVAEEWVGISRDGAASGSIILTCSKCNAYFKPDGELLALSSPEEMQRDGTSQQYQAFTEIENKKIVRAANLCGPSAADAQLPDL